MRIVLLCLDSGVPLEGPKGRSAHLRAVAEPLMRNGHAVHVVVSETSPAPTTLRPASSPPRPAFGPVITVRQGAGVDEVAQRLEALRPDLVIERLEVLAPQGAQAAARLHLKHLYQVNAPLEDEAIAYRGLADVARARAAFSAGFDASTAALAVSDEAAAWVRGLAPPLYRVEVAPDGVHRRFFDDPDPAWMAHAHKTLGEPNGFRIGFVGTFQPWHDLEALIRATGRLEPRVPNRLVLIGDGPSRNRLLAQARAAEARVMLVGAVPEEAVPAYLSACDAVAISYASPAANASPLKLVEAMAAGKAVVASATGPCSRLVRDGVDGLLVPCGDEVAMAGALERIALDPALRDRLGAAARRRVKDGHRWEDVASRMLDLARDGEVRAEARVSLRGSLSAR